MLQKTSFVQSSLSCVAWGNRLKRIFPLKDVEKTHVREDCLLRGQNRTEGREHISGGNAAKLQKQNSTSHNLGSNRPCCLSAPISRIARLRE